ncbi:DUF6585 family protein [Actinomadura sp. 21ATH]|uniref:DUF6585 family protein n=1 Tax=Actinomadura sp. 21ATH TaxID=1735444 RepID=UPI0035BFE57A
MSFLPSFPPSILERASDRKLGEPVRAFESRGGLRRAAAGLLARRRGGGCRAAYLFTGGLVLDEGGGRGAAHRWDELVSVTASGVRHAGRDRTVYRFAVTAADGGRIVLGDELADVRELGETVTAEVVQRVLHGYLERVEAGEPVRIGPFEVGPDGVRREDELVPWPAVDEVDIDNGMVTVRTRDGVRTLTAIASQVPNAVALVTLCRNLAGGNGAPLRGRIQ